MAMTLTSLYHVTVTLVLMTSLSPLAGATFFHPPPKFGSSIDLPGVDLNAARDFLRRIENEKDHLTEKASILKTKRKAIVTDLDSVVEEVKSILASQAGQDQSLEDIRTVVGKQMKVVTQQEARLKRESDVANLLLSLAGELSPSLGKLTARLTSQFALLTRADTLLDESILTTSDKLKATADGTGKAIEALVQNTKAAISVINKRRCFVDNVRLDLNQQTGRAETLATFPSDNFFGGLEPSVFCAVQGFIGTLQAGQTQKVSKGFGRPYGPKVAFSKAAGPDQNFAVSTDCKAIGEGVQVAAYEQSRGDGNDLLTLFVEVRACGFGRPTF